MLQELLIDLLVYILQNLISTGEKQSGVDNALEL